MKKIKPDLFVTYDIKTQGILLPGIGKLCKCGCNRLIISKNPRRRFFNNACRRRNFYKNTHPDTIHKSKNRLHATLKLAPNDDNTRTLTVYLNDSHKEIIKLKPNNPVWIFLDHIYKFRLSPLTI